MSIDQIDLKKLLDFEAKGSPFLNFLDIESKNCPLLQKYTYSKKHDKFKYRLIKKMLDNMDIDMLGGLINQNQYRNIAETLYAGKNLEEARDKIDLLEGLTTEQKEHLKEFILVVHRGLDKKDFAFKTSLDDEIFNKVTRKYGYLILKFIRELTLSGQPVVLANINNKGEVVSYLKHKNIKTNSKNSFKADTVGNHQYSIHNNKISFFSEKRVVSEIKALLDEYKDVTDIIDEQDSRGDSLIMICAASGYVHAVKLLMAYKAKLDLQNELGNTAIQGALLNKHWQIADMLIEAGADLNKKNVIGYTPLTLAISKHCDIAMIEKLLNKGADPNINLNVGISALSIAANYNRVDLMKLLLRHGANVDAQNFQGYSPILCAVKRQNREAVKILLEHGANPNPRTVNHITPLVVAVAKKEEAIAELLIEKGAKLYAVDANYTSLITDKIKKYDQLVLYFSIINNYSGILRSLLEKGADVNLIDEKGALPLATAVIHNNMELTSLLLEKGADPNIKDRQGKTALLYAARNRPEILKIILQFHPDIKVIDNEQNTPLMIAAQYGNTEAIQLLINAGIKINSQNCYGETALMKAVEYNHVESVRLLLSYGTDINIRDQYGSTAILKLSSDNVDILSLLNSPEQYDIENQCSETIIHLVSKNGYLKALEYLLKQGVNINRRNREGHTALMLSVMENNADSVKFLLNAGADTSITDHYNEIPFFKAMHRGYFGIVKLLLEHGVDPNIVTSNGNTALMLAVGQAGAMEMIKVLLRYGADVNIKNKDGETVLIRAVSKRNYFSGHIHVIKLLLEAGADPAAADNNGITALVKAVSKGQPGVVKLLLERKANPNTQDEMGNSLIISAVETMSSYSQFLKYSGKQPDREDKEDYYSVIKVLLAFGCNPDLQNNNGFTALIMAVIKNDFKSARILLKHGCNSNIQTKLGNTALDYANSANNPEMIRLLQKYNASQTDKVVDAEALDTGIKITNDNINEDKFARDPNSLINAAKEGDTNIIKSLLANNSRNIPAKDFGYALYNAVYMKHKEAIRILLDYVVSNNINVTDNLLCTAISRCEPEIVEMLLKYKADPNKPDEFGNYPLIQVVERNSYEMVKLLTEYGANVNILCGGESALMSAGVKGNIDIVNFLLDNGAYPYIQTKFGESLLTKIAEKGHIEIARLLIQKKININSHKESGTYVPLLKAVENGHTEYVSLLLAQGANPDVVGLSNVSALMHAAKNGNIEIVKVLMNYGANLDLLDHEGQTAQKYAEQSGHMDIKDLLAEGNGKLNDATEIMIAPLKKFLTKEDMENGKK